MNLHSDFSQRVPIQMGNLPWDAPAAAGIQRKVIEHDGREAARTTAIVRYVPGTFLETHDGLGEEIVVLEGLLNTRAGNFGPNSYLKNLPRGAHAGVPQTGCTLFVKVGHLATDDRELSVADPSRSPWYPGSVPGLSVFPLAEVGTQHTALVRWEPGTRFNPHRHYGGEEILVLDGVFEDEHGRYPAGAWIRSPHMSLHQPFSPEGCTILVKTGHLPQAYTPASR